MVKAIINVGAILVTMTLGTFAHGAGPDRFIDYYSTRTLTFRTDSNSTESRQLLTTPGKQFLQAVQTALPLPNREIVSLLLEFPDDGTHTYWWPKASEGSYDGGTTDVVVNGVTLMKGETNARTFCCGLTLQVFYLWASTHADLQSKLLAVDTNEFKRAWFCRNINSPGPQDALEEFKLGMRVSHSDALAGDFVQLWRNDRSGHSVIFVNWLYDDEGKRVGLQYWSTQVATDGIGFSSESFGDQPKQINLEHLSVARPSVSN